MHRLRRSWLFALAGLLVATLCFGLPTRSASAAPSPGPIGRKGGGNIGLGVSLGDPMGGSLKIFVHPNHALQLDGGWMPLHHGTGGATFSYLWHPARLASNAALDLVPYLGLGVGLSGHAGRVYWYDDPLYPRYRYPYAYYYRAPMMCMQVRAPAAGLALHFKQAPVDMAFEGGWSPCVVEAYSGRALFGPAHGDVSAKIRLWF